MCSFRVWNHVYSWNINPLVSVEEKNRYREAAKQEDEKECPKTNGKIVFTKCSIIVSP